MTLGNDDNLDHVSLHKGQRRLGVRHIPLLETQSDRKGLGDEICLLHEIVVC